VDQRVHFFPPDPLPIARKSLEARGFLKGEQEALALIAAVIENYPYRPSQIHPDRVPERWLFRLRQLWGAPPGFRDAVLEHLLYEEYKGTVYYELYKEAVHEARAAFFVSTDREGEEETEASPPESGA
jgi:hypothetical protein